MTKRKPRSMTKPEEKEEQTAIPETQAGMAEEKEEQAAIPETQAGMAEEKEEQTAIPETQAGMAEEKEEQTAIPETQAGMAEEKEEQTAIPETQAGMAEAETATKDDKRQRVKPEIIYTQPLNKWGIILGEYIASKSFGIIIFLVLSLIFLGAATYFSWRYFLLGAIAWSNEVAWRWIIGWFLVLFAACIPIYIFIGIGSVIIPAINAAGKLKEEQVLDELDTIEKNIRGSDEPVDFARYSRKALDAYYHMGQNQVRISFYIGVAAMIFGFLFLLGGLLIQVLDTTKITAVPLKPNVNVNVISVGGGIIIEFIAATFLWIYRAAIVQLN